jgi:type I restriction enzyme, S subunit
MIDWNKTPFSRLLVDSKDGEWGKGEEAVGLHEAIIIRGTDFAALDDPGAEFPRRWIKAHIVERKRLQPGDIILETAGGTSTQSTGRSALLKKSFFFHHSDIPVLCASFSRHLRLDRDKYSPRFIYYLLQALHHTGYMAVFNIQHTGVSRFQYTAFKNHTELQIPGLAIQRKIAAIISAYDELIENNKRRIALLEIGAEEIYREWFVRLRFPGHEKVQIVKAVPNGWNVKKFHEIVAYYIGGGWGEDNQSTSFGEGAFVVRGTDIPDVQAGEFEGCPFRFHKPSNLRTRKLQANDFVFEVSGGSTNQLLGRNVLVTERALTFFKGTVIPASFCKLIRFRHELVSPYFMKYFLKLYYDYDLVGIYQVQSTGISNYQFESFLKFQTIILPPDELQREFEDKVRPIIEMRDDIALANIALRNTRNLLLPRLISGKLAVDNLDIQFSPGIGEELDMERAIAHA